MPISRAGRRPVASGIAAVALVALLPAWAEDPPAARPLSEVEKEMKQAEAGHNFARLGELVEEAAALKDPAAYRAIIAYAMRGEDRELELHAFRILKDLEDPQGTAVLYHEAVKNPNYKTRIILLGVAFQRRDDPGAFESLAQATKDASRPVALTAVRWLRLSKDAPRAVPPLIEALVLSEKTRRGRMVYDIKNALRELTGVNLETATDWKNYWETRKLAPPKTATAGSTQARFEKPKFFGIPIESDRILFIIDTSGSMEKKDPIVEMKKPHEPAPPPPESGKTVVRKAATEAKKQAKSKEEVEADRSTLPPERQRLYRVKQELIKTIDSLPENVMFTVETFNNEIVFLDEPPRLMLANTANKKRAQDWVRNMPAKGETWTDTAFERAFQALKDVDTIYFLSDGAPYRNGSNIPQDEVLDNLKTQNRFVKCRIHTIGFLKAGDNLQSFLRQVAKDHDGIYVPLN